MVPLCTYSPGLQFLSSVTLAVVWVTPLDTHLQHRKLSRLCHLDPGTSFILFVRATCILAPATSPPATSQIGTVGTLPRSHTATIPTVCTFFYHSVLSFTDTHRPLTDQHLNNKNATVQSPSCCARTHPRRCRVQQARRWPRP